MRALVHGMSSGELERRKCLISIIVVHDLDFIKSVHQRSLTHMT